MTDALEYFLVGVPGLEPALLTEARALGLTDPRLGPGGVTCRGDWPEIWRANLTSRGASRILVRLGAFRAMHLAQLDKRARKFPWAEVLRPDVPLRVEVTCTASRIYHAGAAAQRIETALREELGATIAPEAPLVLKVRIDDDLCTISLDTSGEGLHKRGFKEAVNKAPMRETMAALFLRDCGYDGQMPVYDPMCGSGTFVIEAAEIAAGLIPGRSRRFAFEDLAGFDRAAFETVRAGLTRTRETALIHHGSDRDAGAIRMSAENAARAGVTATTRFHQASLSEMVPPEGPPGLVICNPPYGGRIGDRNALFGLYATLGQVLIARFRGWRVGIVTNDAGLAKATGLPFLPAAPPVLHGGIRVTLWRCDPLR